VAVSDRSYPERFPEALYYLTIARAFKDATRYDLIDCHVEEKSLFFAPLVKTPVVVTFEFGMFDDEQRQVFAEYRDQPSISISQAVRQIYPGMNWIANVSNGIRVKDFPFSDRPGDYLLLLGRVSAQKGVHHAVEVARRTGKRLLIAGKVVKEDQKYLDKYLWPYVDNDQIKYLGLVSYREKMPLLRNALALLSPLCYLEAFGLNLAEAMACGTPVLAFDRGAAAEVVEDGVTGFILPPDDVEAMAAAVERVTGLDRTACRKRVEESFTVDKMVEGYEAAYRKLLSLSHSKS
jgi:glycosyltransferase involved in cell wall biosynthesis